MLKLVGMKCEDEEIKTYRIKLHKELELASAYASIFATIEVNVNIQ